MCEKQVFAGDDSDADSPKDNQDLATNIEITRGSQAELHERDSANKTIDNSMTEKDTSVVFPIHEYPLSMGEILSSFDPGMSFPGHVAEYCLERHPSKPNGSHTQITRTNFWGCNIVSYFDDTLDYLTVKSCYF